MNPAAFPSLQNFETEIVAMGASLLGGDEDTAGTVKDGVIEISILHTLTDH